MIRIRRGRVTEILSQGQGTTEALALVDGEERKVINYDFLTGPISPGLEVILNTTAVELGLGTGGYDFVIYASGNDALDPAEHGHIMKLRYTPFQVKTLSVEEPGSPYHKVMSEASSLLSRPVVVGSLHSMLAPAAVAYREMAGPARRLAYVMTDGAALPLAFSRLVRKLKEAGIVDVTITSGHTFGGDLEAVNIYSALLAAVWAAKADVVVVCMGPGVVGTETTFGSTALELGQIVDAVNTLGGTAIAIPRLSFADERERHQGVSHHTLTALGKIALSRATVAVPHLPDEQMTKIMSQFAEARVDKKHNLLVTNAGFISEALKRRNLEVTTMGRSFESDPAFFLAAAAAGVIAAKYPAGSGEGEQKKDE